MSHLICFLCVNFGVDVWLLLEPESLIDARKRLIICGGFTNFRYLITKNYMSKYQVHTEHVMCHVLL